MSDSLQPHGLKPTRLLCPWDSPGKNTGGGCHFLLQGIFLTQGSNPCLLYLLHWQAGSLYTLIYPFFFGFPSHLGHHRALSRVPCAIQQDYISYLFYTQQCIYVIPNFPIHPTPPSPPWYPYICSLYLCIYFCKNWLFETVEINKVLLKLTQKRGDINYQYQK